MLNRFWLLAIAAAYLAACLLQVACTTRPPQGEAPMPPLRQEEAVVDIREDGGAPARRGIPPKPEPWQKKPPCDPEFGEEEVRGACYIRVDRRPPCGKLLEHESRCFRAIAKAPREPTSVKER